MNNILRKSTISLITMLFVYMAAISDNINIDHRSIAAHADAMRPIPKAEQNTAVFEFDDIKTELILNKWNVYELKFISPSNILGMQECLQDCLIYAKYAGFDEYDINLTRNFFGNKETRSEQVLSHMIVWMVRELCSNVGHAPAGTRSLVAIKLNVEQSIFCILYYNNSGSSQLQKILRQRRNGSKITGRGYGLKLVRYMVRASGGAIGIFSDQWKGTRIKIAIPAFHSLESIPERIDNGNRQAEKRPIQGQI